MSEGWCTLKKIILFTFFLMILLPFSVTSAYPGGYLNGKSITYGDSGTSTARGSTSFVTDSNESTSFTLNSKSPTQALWYNFPAPVTVGKLRLKSSIAVNVYVNNVLYTSVPFDGTDYVFPTPVDNVTRIFISPKSTAADPEIIDFDVFAPDLTANPEPEKFVIESLKLTVNTGTSVSLSWSPVNSQYLKHYKVFRNDVFLTSVSMPSYSVSGLDPGSDQVFKVVPVDTFGKDYSGSSLTYTVPLPDTTPPAVPVNIKVTPDRYRASVTADPVPDLDLAGYHVYVNGNRVTSQPVQLPYDLTGLKLETEYEVEVASIDTSGNLSDRSTKVAFKTLGLETEPAAVTTLTGTPFNGGATLSWSPVAAAKEYKIYKGDGTLIMKTTQTNAKIQRLKNGQVVTFYVIASNDIGDSPKSNVVEVKPDSTLAPDVTLGYSLKEVADGTSSWFNSYWLILAFSISIPLSFYVSNRIKGLFVS